MCYEMWFTLDTVKGANTDLILVLASGGAAGATLLILLTVGTLKFLSF